jgi:hypothetical protein
MAVPTTWKIRMTAASDGFSSLKASIATWIASAARKRKS